jgi:pimeloyl-ACP methyl ester carboxylesterase
MNGKCIIFGIFLLIWNSQAAFASYEDDFVNNLVRNHAGRGVVWLDSDSGSFLNLYSEALDGNQSRAVIILHSIGMHADWPDLISPLRKALTRFSWSTFSVQLPVLSPQTGHSEYGNTFQDGNERIRSAVLYLQDRGYSDIAIIGYGFGASVALDYLVKNNSVIKALVGISMEDLPFLKPRYDLIDEIERVTVPVLDIYGSRDTSSVLKSADDRRLSGGKLGAGNYTQRIVSDADHYFMSREGYLAQQLAEWLNFVIVPNIGQNE